MSSTWSRSKAASSASTCLIPSPDPLDPDSLRYRQHWESVLAAPARRALERIEGEPASLLDLGAGTGSLTLVAAERWPAARIVALDASAAMLDVARSRVGEADARSGRLEWLVADAARIPLGDDAVDVAASSFMLQIPSDRPAVLRELLRVMKPGGTFSFVTWLADDLVLPADAAYHDALGDIGDDDEDGSFRTPRSGDYFSLEQAHDELVEVGFEGIKIQPDELRYTWTAESYLAFKVDYDDHERFDSLEAARRGQLLSTLEARLATLPPDDFEVRGPLVAATAHKPAS